MDAILEFAAPRLNAKARTVTGMAVPWNKAGTAARGVFNFKRGSISWDTANVTRIKLLDNHDTNRTTALLGMATSIEDRADGGRSPEAETAFTR